MNRVVFRADGSPTLGMGHIMRCAAFAEHLRGVGVATEFVVKSYDRRVDATLRQAGHAVVEIPAQAGWDDDVKATREAAKRFNADTIVTDIGHAAAIRERAAFDSYHGSLARTFSVVCLAGNDIVSIPGDLVVSPYYRTRYPEPPANGPTVLLGPAYFIFCRAFASVAHTARHIPEQGRTVLITVGGSDERRSTNEVIHAIRLLDDPDLSVRVLIGPAFSDDVVREIRETATACAANIQLLTDVKDLGALMLWADLAICGDGLTKYETALAGTPTIVLKHPRVSTPLSGEFQQAGSSIAVDTPGSLECAGVINRVLRDREARKSMSSCGRAISDGLGLDRITAAMMRQVHS